MGVLLQVKESRKAAGDLGCEAMSALGVALNSVVIFPSNFSRECFHATPTKSYWQ
jgi:hypothetical protein